MHEIADSELYRLIMRSVLDVSPWRADHAVVVARLRERRAALGDCADVLLDVLTERGWWSGVDRRAQVWVSLDPRQIPAQSRMTLDLRPFGGDVSKPRRAFWTSTPISEVVSGWIEWLRSGDDRRPGPYHPWLLTVADEARVAEIHSPDDWRRFAHQYSTESSQGRAPVNWEQVRRDWDAVHLSVGGLLTAHAPAVAGAPDAELLEGWHMESTVWLRWAFTSVTRLPPIGQFP
jgi:hypothetical protein